MESRTGDLAAVFIPLYLVTIGGGQSALADIHR
jgi:hypothetical protein